MRWKLYGAAATLIVLGIAGLVARWFASDPSPPAETLTVADAQHIASTLLYIAVAQDYVTEEGLQVIVQRYATGKAALAAVLDRQADIATVAEVPFMLAVLEGQPVQVFATTQTTDEDIAITARAGAGITMPADLAGKRIGSIPGTNGAYFLDLFLAVHGLQDSGVVIVPYEPAEAVAALAARSVGAVAVWTMLRVQAQARLPQGTVNFFGNGVYTTAWTLTAREELLHQRPSATQKLLRALLKAERFASAHRPQAVDIVACWLDLERGTVAALWDHFRFTVRLDQALVVHVEDQTRTLRQAQPLLSQPNVLQHVSLHGLAAVAPHRVNVPH